MYVGMYNVKGILIIFGAWFSNQKFEIYFKMHLNLYRKYFQEYKTQYKNFFNQKL